MAYTWENQFKSNLYASKLYMQNNNNQDNKLH